jgi:hypothetical protein
VTCIAAKIHDRCPVGDVFACGQCPVCVPSRFWRRLHNSISMRFVESDGPRGRVVGLSPFRTGEGYFLPVHVGQLAWVQGSGHFIAEEKPAVLLSYLHDFLAK